MNERLRPRGVQEVGRQQGEGHVGLDGPGVRLGVGGLQELPLTWTRITFVKTLSHVWELVHSSVDDAVSSAPGVQPGEASTHAAVASVSTFLDDHASLFLDYMKGHFDKSLGYLLTGNGFGDQSIQRPGLAKMLKDESDRHWNLGIGALKKYLQRGGKTPAELQPSVAENDLKSATAPPSPQEVTFKNKFAFHGNNSLSTVNKGSPDFRSTYLLQCERLVTDCKSSVVLVNELHRMSMRRTGGQHGDFDADMGHYFEELLEEEVGLMRKFSNLYTNLEKMANLGLAQHIFDNSLSD